ncbi:poly(ADP-ribose) glycohydrolase domain-containing protein [Legionella maioricensis]|uniref:DUF2263 domain-containing protein n=1 Tax=Legionella maioricensis TaxID=2896528 RepID=A0A9X2CZU6_9GAMM|nr:poly(ADP-ribose) glycohydrolase domain-containing protein [Legionella maioricensis]MCL9683613.1 DUF2263 domain-containing protein [Legionella maioricensis]MCL9687635.1 DUF2263 domain-containing protein [Legionella maioricensis]
MKSLYERIRPGKTNLSLLKEVHAAHQPSILSGLYSERLWRHKSMRMTLKYITDPSQYEVLQSHATANLKLWQKTKVKLPCVVEVINQDWGDATLEATKKSGTPYAVLNMANSQFPGGASLEGGSAQEENMWLRTTCSLSLLDKGIYFDKESNTFRYEDETRDLLRAMKKMTSEELNTLSQRRKETIAEAYHVFLNKKLQICFRGAELFIETDSSEGGKPMRIAESTMSFPFLHPQQIFPFYELRSAAADLSDNKMDWSDALLLERYKKDMRRRVAGQLDTLILNEKSHVILGAWGCGAFKNKPDFVAEVYREEIEKRAKFFDHIVFPIINAGSSENFNVFRECLNGLKLGKEPNRSHFFPALTDTPSKTEDDLLKGASKSAPLV